MMGLHFWLKTGWGKLENQKWLTATEAAQYLRVQQRTILAWARTGKLKGYTLSGTKRKVWRFLLADLDGTMTPRPFVTQ